MQLEKVKIDNFRNIGHAEYNLKKINIFHGPNAQGKTNTILAIYWALADYLMDGSSDYPTFKPHKDTSKEVSVELTFDSFSFKKTYQEKWVKTRGSAEVRLEGHTTDYFIDDVKYAVGEGKRLLLENLGLSDVKVSRMVDMVRAIIDPYYLAQQLPWKDLRVFIIDLVGDVGDEMVLDSKPIFAKIKDDLVRQKFNTSGLTQLYRQTIKKNKDEIEANENYVVGFQKILDVDAVDLKQAVTALEEIDAAVARLMIQKETANNPNIQLLEREIAKARLEFADSRDADRKFVTSENASTQQEIERLQGLLGSKNETLLSLKNKESNQHFLAQKYEMELKLLNTELESKQKERDRLVESWEELEATEYQSTLKETTCPHCGGVLNEAELEKHHSHWEEEKELGLKRIVQQGQSIKLEIENLTFKLNDLVKPELIDFSTEISSLAKDVEHIQVDITDLKSKLLTDYESEATKGLKERGKQLAEKLEEEKAVKSSNDIEQQIASKQSEKAKYQLVVDEHNVFLATQKKVKETQETIKALQVGLTENESKLMLLEEFIKTKLELLKENVASVFGEIEFVLIEANIKEGSYSEVCYPLILGQKTPFLSGSGAEKIITGIHIIESVKAKLGLGNAPIIFDEADKLDTQTLALRLNTSAQLISTKVDDINYEKVTLVAK